MSSYIYYFCVILPTPATVIVTIESDKQEQLQFSPPLTAANPDIRVTVPEEEDVGHIVYRLVALDPSTSRPVTNYEKVKTFNQRHSFILLFLRSLFIHVT